MAEIRDGKLAVADPRRELIGLAVRQAQERVQETQFMHDLQCGRMDRVAAEIAQEIAVLFQHDDIDAGAGEQKPRH